MTASTPSVRAVHANADSGRSARLAERVRRLRTRTATGSLDRWMLVLGGLLMPLGVLLILLGWLGVSHTPLPFEQNSYLISGGILGLALVIAGGFVYFGYWQTVRIRESREQTRELTAAVDRLQALLTATGAAGEAALADTFVATANGTIYHRRDCTVVAGRTDLRRVDPDRDGLAPCRICDPLAGGR